MLGLYHIIVTSFCIIMVKCGLSYACRFAYYLYVSSDLSVAAGATVHDAEDSEGGWPTYAHTFLIGNNFRGL